MTVLFLKIDPRATLLEAEKKELEAEGIQGLLFSPLSPSDSGVPNG